MLVIDDNESFSAFIKAAFEDEFDLAICQDGEEGIACAENSVPDIILLDVNMPGLSGIEVIKRLLSRPETRRIPVLVLSATDYNIGTESLFRREKNVRGFLTKLAPVNSMKELILKNLRDKKESPDD